MKTKLIWRLTSYLQYPFQKARFQALAHPFKVIYIDPRCVRTQLRKENLKRKTLVWGLIKDGDWDEDVRYRYGDEDTGYQSMYKHFHEGLPWEDTPTFANYAERLTERGSTKGGALSLAELTEYYRSHIDLLYNDIKISGFRSPSDPEIDPIYVYIGRDGELIYSGGGNHRLHIAKCLNIKEFPVFVRVRHLRWQMVREMVKSNTMSKEMLMKYRNHPDLQDLL